MQDCVLSFSHPGYYCQAPSSVKSDAITEYTFPIINLSPVVCNTSTLINMADSSSGVDGFEESRGVSVNLHYHTLVIPSGMPTLTHKKGIHQ